MIRTIPRWMCASLLCTAPTWLFSESSRVATPSGERTALHANERPDLAKLRAGAAFEPRALAGDEREILLAASRSSSALRDLRGGDLNLSNRDLEIIGIAVLATLILVAIL